MDWKKVRHHLAEQLPAGEWTPAVQAVARRLAQHGDYPAAQWMRQPSLASWLTHGRWRSDPRPRAEMADDLRAFLDAIRLDNQGDDPLDDVLSPALRQFRHRQLMRIFLREIEGASLRRTTAEVADVAQVCLQVALEDVAAAHGLPDLPHQFCVIGMGKLGGRELNFSSDIDLVFVASDDCRTDHASHARVEQATREVVRLIDEVTDLGRVFRVDLRLRPEGSRGPLIPSASGLVDYCLHWGTTWERGAWLKARPVAGNLELGSSILQQLEPFLFRRSLDFDAIDELRRMKELIDEEARAADFLKTSAKAAKTPPARVSSFKRKLMGKFSAQSVGRATPPTPQNVADPTPPEHADPLAGWDVKIGQGGIREIEFFVQALQLVHCGLRPELRVRTTLDALDRLLYAGLVAAADHARLADAYDLLRRVEHRIQMAEDRQSHRLPTDEEQWIVLAQRLDTTTDELRGELTQARRDVREIFERLFEASPRRGDKATVGEDQESILQRIIGLPAGRLLDDSVLQSLAAAGFARPRQIAGQLQVLRQKSHGPFSEHPRFGDPQVARHLLAAVRDAPDPEAALGHLVRFATAVGDAPHRWAMLTENPHAARLLIHLFGSSPPLANLLAREPRTFERLIYGGAHSIVRTREEVAGDLPRRVEGVTDRSRRIGRIRHFHHEQVLRLALHEVAGAVEVEQTCSQLTDLAQVVIERLFREVAHEWAPQSEVDPLSELPLALVGMGKLGGGEMGFGSDLDFFFVYDADHRHGLEHQRATSLARRFVRALTNATEMGSFYEIDLRLRPSGSRGTLVVSVDAWRDYHLHRAALWERQALTRARALTGPPELRRQLDRARRSLAFERPLPDGARQEIAVMRGRLADAAIEPGAGFDMKFGEGGLLDVEFLVQWLQLSTPDEEVLGEARSTFDALRALTALEQGPARALDREALLRDYIWLRRLECRMSIAGLGTQIPQEGVARRSLVRQMGHQGRQGDRHFDVELQEVRRRIHHCWEQIFGSHL